MDGPPRRSGGGSGPAEWVPQHRLVPHAHQQVAGALPHVSRGLRRPRHPSPVAPPPHHALPTYLAAPEHVAPGHPPVLRPLPPQPPAVAPPPAPAPPGRRVLQELHFPAAHTPNVVAAPAHVAVGVPRAAAGPHAHDVPRRREAGERLDDRARRRDVNRREARGPLSEAAGAPPRRERPGKDGGPGRRLPRPGVLVGGRGWGRAGRPVRGAGALRERWSEAP